MSDVEYDVGDFVAECVQTLVEANPEAKRDEVFVNVLRALNMVKNIRESPLHLIVWQAPGEWSGVIIDMLKKADGVGVQRPYETMWSENEEVVTFLFS